MDTEIENELKKIEDALNQIHNELTTNCDTSGYQILLLEKKLQLLEELLFRVLNRINTKINKNFKKFQKNKFINYVVSFIMGMALLFSIKDTAVTGIFWGTEYFLIKKWARDKKKEEREQVDSYQAIISRLESRIWNYCDILSARYEKIDEKSYDEVEDKTNEFWLANSLIEIYLTLEDRQTLDIPVNLVPYMIQILKEDLKSESNDLEELLFLAKSKLSEENLKRELSLEF